MSTKRLKPSDERELIAQIKEGLAGYEEDYAPGAWENFQKKGGKKRGPVFWMFSLSGVAALLLLTFGLFLYVNKNSEIAVVTKQVSASVPEQNNSVSGQSNQPKLAETNNREEDTIRDQSTRSSSPSDVILTNRPIVTTVQEPVNTPVVVAEQIVAVPKNDFSGNDKPVEAKAAPITLDEFLAKENALNSQAKSKPADRPKNNKWDLGVVVAPSIGNSKKLNMGYGMSMAYNVSKKVSLSSGLSYNEMGVSKDLGAVSNYYDAAPANAFASDSKNLEEVNTQITGIDIPLEMKYRLSQRFYASAGVSAFAVINQKQSNTYQQNTVQQSTTVSPAGDVKQESYLVTQKVTENVPATEVSKRSVIGFYNFSFGYQQKVSKDKSIGIEPFIKLPMRDISKENLRLMGTGLKIRFDF
ncbi:hypothetical protein ACXZ1K_03160 [Pedobacter sp. PWIIR3]